MIDTLSIIGLVLSILIVACFFLLIIIQINSYSNNKVENLSFILALIAGLIAISTYIFDLIIWVNNSCNINTTNQCILTRSDLNGLLFFFFTISFYFWFKHYQKIILFNSKKYSLHFDFLKRFNFISNAQYSISFIDILFFSGIFLNTIIFLGYFFGFGKIFDLFWQLVALPNPTGRFVTFLSLVATLSGGIFLYITYIIIKNNLIELGKVTIFELFSMTVLGFTSVILLINDVLITYNVYGNDLNNLIVNIGLFTIFISLIILLVDYILLQPTHIQSPSLYKDIAELIKTIKIEGTVIPKSENELPKLSPPSQDITQLEIPQKLNGTGIIILIYLMKNEKAKNLLAKDLESNLNLNKSTISYNLKILETNSFISRKSPIEISISGTSSEDDLDQRQKRILINENGKKFLIELQKYLNSIFY